MSETKHTQLPWSVAYYSLQEGAECASHYSIKRGERSLLRTINQVATDEDDANAEFIVRACNSFEALLEALRQVEQRLWNVPGEEPLYGQIHAQIRAVIALAEGRAVTESPTPVTRPSEPHN